MWWRMAALKSRVRSVLALIVTCAFNDDAGAWARRTKKRAAAHLRRRL